MSEYCACMPPSACLRMLQVHLSQMQPLSKMLSILREHQHRRRCSRFQRRSRPVQHFRMQDLLRPVVTHSSVFSRNVQDGHRGELTASISAAVASSTRRFRVKMQPVTARSSRFRLVCVIHSMTVRIPNSPSASLRSSQELPLPVASLTSPGAKVPDCKACCGSPPMDAICLASSSTICLFRAWTPGEAAS